VPTFKLALAVKRTSSSLDAGLDGRLRTTWRGRRNFQEGLGGWLFSGGQVRVFIGLDRTTCDPGRARGFAWLTAWRRELANDLERAVFLACGCSAGVAVDVALDALLKPGVACVRAAMPWFWAAVVDERWSAALAVAEPRNRHAAASWTRGRCATDLWRAPVRFGKLADAGVREELVVVVLGVRIIGGCCCAAGRAGGAVAALPCPAAGRRDVLVLGAGSAGDVVTELEPVGQLRPCRRWWVLGPRRARSSTIRKPERWLRERCETLLVPAKVCDARKLVTFYRSRRLTGLGKLCGL
jgi:hypothetical protein